MIAGSSARDTIFALSSGALPAAIAVVRISGPAAGDALRTLARRLPVPRMASMVTLRTGPSDLLLDRALVLWLPGPGTATGEDIAELHLHGGRATVAAVLAALAALPGLRPAEPGAFTRQAFANGRLDLAEAEGLADLLAAETEGQRRSALLLTEGGLGRLIGVWRDRLLDLSARVEAALGFEDEGDEVGEADRDLDTSMALLAGEIAQALAQPPAERLRDGVRIVIGGPVNSGKSSLINYLAGREVAIAAPVPGTTRDLVEAPVVIDGIACVLTDSAGLRDTEDAVERIGVARAEAAIAKADLLLWLGKAEDAPSASDRLIVHSRMDLPGRMRIPVDADHGISVVTGEGVSSLRAAIGVRARAALPAEGQVALNSRQRHLLKCAMTALLEPDGGDLLLTAENLRLARGMLDRITGRAGTEEMFDALFARFCIGK